MYQVAISWYNSEPSISISITIQFRSIIPNTGHNTLFTDRYTAKTEPISDI